jgi:hypothetical protein
MTRVNGKDIEKTRAGHAQKKKYSCTPWLMPAILTTQEAEIRRIKVQSHPGQIVQETLSQKINPS